MRRWRDDRSCNSAPTLNWRRGARAAAAGTECATAPTCPEGAKEGSQGPARPRFPGEAIQLRADAAPPPVSGAVAEALPRSAGQPGPARSARPRKCRKVLTGRPDDPTDDPTTRRQRRRHAATWLPAGDRPPSTHARRGRPPTDASMGCQVLAAVSMRR